MHEKAVCVFEDLIQDMDNFLQGNVESLSADEKKCYSILSGQKDAMMGFLNTIFDFEKSHKVIIERFGRYPHRNQALGRASTAEEVEYLENGGETFG